MKFSRLYETLGLAVLAAITSQFAVADDSGWYLGANAGQSRAKIDDTRITSQLLGAGMTTTSMMDDDHDSGYKLFAGYQISKSFAIEGGYFNLGKFSYLSTTTPAGQGKRIKTPPQI
jgi:OOP family OmpA-OmpF porin